MTLDQPRAMPRAPLSSPPAGTPDGTGSPGREAGAPSPAERDSAARESAERDSMAGPDSPTNLPDALRLFLRFPSPRVVLASALIAVVARVAVADWSLLDLAVVAGIVAVWPLQEWLIHVFILHYKPVRFLGRTWDFPTPVSHRVHHGDPWNLGILFIPVHVFWYAIPLQVALWFGLAPTAGVALTGLATYFLLTANYEWTHYLVHTRVKPSSRYYERLWRNHRLHHCKNEHYWFGVSRLAGDRLLGTAPAPGEVPTSRTCRTLGLEAVMPAPR